MKIWVSPRGRTTFNEHWSHLHVNYQHLRKYGLGGIHDAEVDIYLPWDYPDDIEQIVKSVCQARIYRMGDTRD